MTVFVILPWLSSLRCVLGQGGSQSRGTVHHLEVQTDRLLGKLYKMLRVTYDGLASHLGVGGGNTPSRFMLQKSEKLERCTNNQCNSFLKGTNLRSALQEGLT